MSRDSDNESILSPAIRSKSPDMFKVAMACLEHHVGSTEVWNMS